MEGEKQKSEVALQDVEEGRIFLVMKRVGMELKRLEKLMDFLLNYEHFEVPFFQEFWNLKESQYRRSCCPS